MAFSKEHELHTRRRGRNLGIGLTLLAFVAVVFGLTIAKIGNGSSMQAFDHAPRQELVPETQK